MPIARSKNIVSPSKRAHVFYLHDADVDLSGNVLAYTERNDVLRRTQNIPVSNTSMVMLGQNTTVSQASLRKLSDAGVVLCLCHHGIDDRKTYQLIEPQTDITNDYPALQWMRMLVDEDKTLEAAKTLLREKLRFTQVTWEKLESAQEYGLFYEDVHATTAAVARAVGAEKSTMSDLRRAATNFSSHIYEFAAPIYGFHHLRQHGGENDLSRAYLDIARLYAFGYAAVALHAAGIPASLSILSRKSGRSGLAVDLSSVAFEGLFLPIALESAMLGIDEEDFSGKLRIAAQTLELPEFMNKIIRAICEAC